MHFNLKRLFHFFVVLVLSLTIIYLPSHAQHRSGGMNADGNLLGGSKAGSGGGYIPTAGWTIAANGGFEKPLGDLKDTYKAAPTFGITLSKRTNHFILSAAVDYRQYEPIQSVYPIELEFMGQTTIIGSITINNFKGIGAYVGGAYEMLITPGSSFYIGLNGGYIFSSTTLTIDDGTTSESGSVKDNIPFISPKIGLNVAVTNRINLGVEARYSVGISKGNYNITTADTPTQSFKSVTGNLFLSYSF